MRIFRLADLFEHKYQLASYAVDDKAFEEARKSLKSFRDSWLDGPRVKDQSILVWADNDNKGPQFDLIRSLISIVKKLAIHPSLSAVEAYTDIKKALTIAKTLKDSTIEEILNAIILSMKGRLRDPDINRFRLQATKIRTFLRMLDSVYEKAAIIVGKFVPATTKAAIDEESKGGYELQKPGQLSRKEISDFAKYHPEAARFGLDDEEVIAKMLGELQLRPLIERLIRAIKRGHSPKAGAEVMSVTDSLRELQRKLQTNLSLFDASEEDAKRQLDMPRQLEEEEDKQKEWQALTPAQQWSRQMQESKRQLALEHEDQPPAFTKEQIKEKIEKRDLEHQQRLDQKKKDEEALLNKYNGLTFEQWMRK